MPHQLNLIKKETLHERLRRNICNLKICGANKQSITQYFIPKELNDLNPKKKKKTRQKEIQKEILNRYNETISCNLTNFLI